MKAKILIIDDDQELNELLTDYLSQFDIDVFTANRPEIGLEMLTKVSPDLIVLDVMLPEKNGFEVCKEIRTRTNTPIIMLTARGDLSDRVIGLELGADDYIPKPYEPRELVARIQSVLRRTQKYAGLKENPKTMRSENLAVNLNAIAAFMENKNLDLTTMEFQILCFFMRNPGVTLTRDQILEAVRGIEWDSVDRTIDVLISRLRHKLGDGTKNSKYIKTVWGSGYRFLGEVSHE